MTSYPVHVHGLFFAPAHRFYHHPKFIPGPDDLVSTESLPLQALQGIPGDRFFGKGPDFNGHVTFFALEVYAELLRMHFPGETPPPPNLHPGVFRRNVILSGVDLRALIGQEFRLQGIRFEGTQHCAPCDWMNVAFGPGALTSLRGRGGLRARVLDSGHLHLGPASLETAATFHPAQAALPILSPDLP